MNLEQREHCRCAHLGKNTGVLNSSKRVEVREKISQKLKGRKPTEAWREKLRLSHLGKKRSPQSLEKLRFTLSRESVRNHISCATRLGMSKLEVKEKMRVSHTGKKRSPESIEKSRLAHYRDGTGNLPYTPEFSERLKAQIRDRDNHMCQMPGCYLPKNGRKHPVHHIDFDKKNQDWINLIELCYKCHAQTFKGDKEFWIEFLQELQILRGIVSAPSATKKVL